MYVDLVLMKEMSWVLQFFPLKDIIKAILMFTMLGSHWDDNMELYWDIQLEAQMELS